MVLESRADYGSEYEAIRSVASKLGVTSPESLRKGVRQAEVDGGIRVGKTTEEIAEIGELKKEVAELRRANEILQRASAFFAELDRPHRFQLPCTCEHRQESEVEPICTVLTEHGCSIAPSTYQDNLHRKPSKRVLRDGEILAVMGAEREAARS